MTEEQREKVKSDLEAVLEFLEDTYKTNCKECENISISVIKHDSSDGVITTASVYDSNRHKKYVDLFRFDGKEI